MNEKVIKQNDKVVKEGSFRKKGDENSGYKSSLQNKPITSGVDHNGHDILEGIQNINICSDSFLSEKKKNIE